MRFTEKCDELEAEMLSVITETSFKKLHICDIWWQAPSGENFMLTTLWNEDGKVVVTAEDFIRDIDLTELSLYELAQITDQLVDEYGKKSDTN